ncbi:MAG: glycoside hydrolase family 99-like domain-containing protein, partial [Planctomycetes bacterium]|nr:glycoside hydrolase family 99-like domain-containing protein [Planctomycetota bacterium]
MVDWYWSKGNRHLEHWLHDAYMKARHRKHLKWCIMWANHNAPDTHSADDWRDVTQYWIDHYLKMDEYYRIDGRPAVFIWAPHNIRRDVGGTDEAAKLYAMSQKMARDAGLPGIYFVAMSSNDSEARCKELGSEGYEAFTTYHGFQLAASRAGARRFPFADVVETSPEVWEAADERASGLRYIPIADTGWASQPWHKSKALVIHDRTPELFGELSRKLRAYAEQKGKKIVALGPINEWGEGSYIEPYAEYGFQDLDQLRAAFCAPGEYPPNLIPSDVGLGPYDLPPMTAKTAWEFATDGDREGWTPNGHVSVRVKGGLLVGETTGNDPVLQGPGIQIEAASTGTLTIRMRASAADSGRVFWATSTSNQSEANSLGFDVIGDGQFHDYRLDFTQSPRWRGLITSVRLDPATKPGVEFAVEEIRFR